MNKCIKTHYYQVSKWLFTYKNLQQKYNLAQDQVQAVFVCLSFCFS